MIKAFAAFEPKGELKPFEYDPGELKAHEVEIDVHYSGICHSDLSVIDNEWGMTQYPVAPGHEVVGKIAKVGDHVKHLTVSQIVGLRSDCIYLQRRKEERSSMAGRSPHIELPRSE